jgi:rhodanese-related sulfurtransferase
MTHTQDTTPQTLHPSSIPAIIDASTLKSWLEHQSIVLIDVREPVEYATEHIPGAISHPLSQFDPQQIQPQIQPQSGKQLVLYCQSGKRSARAAQQLGAAGISATQLECGITSWKAESYLLEKHQDAPISLFRQVQIVAGLLILLGTIIGAAVSPWGLLLSGLVGAGLMFAGITNTCAMGMLLAKLPYNQRAGQRWN